VAGKTGTSHDGWFAGFSSKLICIVWVGFDDNRPLDLEGARSALPVWAEFMKRAYERRDYRNVSEFSAPAGVTSVQIDPESGLLATASCPQVRTEYFIEGSQPVESCNLHGGGAMHIAGWDSPNPPSGDKPAVRRASTAGADAAAAGDEPAAPADSNTVADKTGQPKKKGILGKIRDIFK
jgi:penicillin-binding protein 1B